MKKISIFIVIFVLIIAIPIAWYLISPIFKVVELKEESPLDAKQDKIIKDDDMPSGPKIIFEAIFQPRAHDVKGKAILIDADGKKILRFEDFDTINGPDLRVYLSSELGNEDFVELGKLKATKGSFNYEIPENVDLSKYKNVLVWCKTFGVIFSYAELK